MEPINEEDAQQRREYSRIEAYVPFEYRILAREEKDCFQASISGQSAVVEYKPLPDMRDYDPILQEWLKMLNLKLDTVIRLLTLHNEGYSGLPLRAISISGSGMSFSLPQGIPLGELLEIKVVLTVQQSVALSIYGEVVKSEQRNNNYFTAIRYVRMDELVRNEIIRYVFEREREMIRGKRS